MDHDAYLDQLLGQQPALPPAQHLPDHFPFAALEDDEFANLDLELLFGRHFGRNNPPENDNNAVREMPPVRRSQGNVDPELSTEACIEAALNFFPDICPDYLRKTVESQKWTAQGIVGHILDQQESGKKYPKRVKSLKRKWEDTGEDGEEVLSKKMEAEPRFQGKTTEYMKKYKGAGRSLLVAEFPDFKVKNIEQQFKLHDHRIYPAYLALWTELAQETSAWRKKSTTRPKMTLGDTVKMFSESADEGEKGAVEDFVAARQVCDIRTAKARAKKALEDAEAANYAQAEADGTILECGCCFGDFPQNRMVHCNAETVHFFCRECAKRMAETQVGISKYQLDCMSTDGCEGTFSKSQKDLFLDGKLTVALDRIEQEAVLRLAGIESLETCPFCPYAAEYPPVEVDKEFRCISEECGRVSCRLCRLETHTPKTCQEVARESGHSARREIEEAMSAAMIRTCNKCKTPFIKENGCNKMTCTRKGCGNIQCYVCSKSCDYSHFDEPARGGKPGNCRLFDETEERHAREVREAEEAARKKVAEANPEVDSSLLEIKFSDKVKQDEAKRAAAQIPQRGGVFGPRNLPVYVPPRMPVIAVPPNQPNAPVPAAPMALRPDQANELQRRMQGLIGLDLEIGIEPLPVEAHRNVQMAVILPPDPNREARMQQQQALLRAQIQAQQIQMEQARNNFRIQREQAAAQLNHARNVQQEAMQNMQRQELQLQQHIADHMHRFPQGVAFPAVPRPAPGPVLMNPEHLFAPAGAAGRLFNIGNHAYHEPNPHHPAAAVGNPQQAVAVPNRPQAVAAPNLPPHRVANAANNNNVNDGGPAQQHGDGPRPLANDVINLTASPPAPRVNGNGYRAELYSPRWGHGPPPVR
ncbi:Putative E3 ubiquitin-protein ligase [Podospora comata]|uniref:E3 ubiquitin-protein ligase n=1 Tax=Podospora comata TaxID=48703 RepID=A0ABY6SHI6_PODCO|nr:Putative E3 ubiquitin-protein ligase [Podospora comata]